MVTIQPLKEPDIQSIANAFVKLGWQKPALEYKRYLEDQRTGKQVVLVATVDDGLDIYFTKQLK